MKNKLFIICPFSTMEPYLQKRYGEDSYFMTSTGAVCPIQENEYFDSIIDLVERENIDSIYFVNDISCRFINSVVNRTLLFGLPAEERLNDIFIQNYYSLFEGKDIEDQKAVLAECNINNQAGKLMSSDYLERRILSGDIQLKGLICCRCKDELREVEVKHLQSRI